MGLLNRLDTAALTALTGHREQKEARRFAATVQPGHTYYSVVDCHWPWGKGRLLMEWTFGKRSRLTGQPMCGHLTPAGLWLSYGPIHEKRPGGLQTLAEYERMPGRAPDPARALDMTRLVPAGV